MGLRFRFLKAASVRPPRGISLHSFTSRHSGEVLCQGPPLAGWGHCEALFPSCGGHILGRGGADGMVNCGFVSYRLARVKWVLFSETQTHVHGVKNAISSTVTIAVPRAAAPKLFPVPLHHSGPPGHCTQAVPLAAAPKRFFGPLLHSSSQGRCTKAVPWASAP